MVVIFLALAFFHAKEKLCYTGLCLNEYLGLMSFKAIYDEAGDGILAFRCGLKTEKIIIMHDTIAPYVQA